MNRRSFFQFPATSTIEHDRSIDVSSWLCRSGGWTRPKSVQRRKAWTRNWLKLGRCHEKEPFSGELPWCGKHTRSNWEAPLLMGESAMSIAIFTSYVGLPEVTETGMQLMQPSIEGGLNTFFQYRDLMHQTGRKLFPGHHPSPFNLGSCHNGRQSPFV